MRKALVLGAVLAAAAGLSLTGSPAEATSVTFTLTGGSLSIAQPAGPAALTGGALAGLAGSSLTGSLGSTTVTDQRGGVTGWTTTIAQGTAFTDGSTTIPVGNTKAWVGSAIVPTGVATVTSGTYLTQATGLALTALAQNFVTATAVVGNNSASFTPSLAVTIPSNATAGDYTGAITQTVS